MITLNQGQQKALSSAVQFLLSPTETEMVIKGRPGTGKSTLVKELIPTIEGVAKTVAMLLQQDGVLPIYLTATTNKAAKVLAEVTGRPAETIHTLIGLTVKQDFKTGGSKLVRKGNGIVLENAVVVLDEAFYADKILKSYIDKSTKKCKIIYIGDSDQCAPVMQTHSPISDLQCRTEELTQVMRNKGAISILSEHWRNIVNTGVFTPLVINDPSIVYTNGTGFQQEIANAYMQPGIDENTNKILCWTNNQSINYSNHVRKLHGFTDNFSEGEYLVINNSLSKSGYPTDSIIRIKQFNCEAVIHGIKGRNATLYDGNDLFIPYSSMNVKQQLDFFAKHKQWTEHYDIKDRVPDLRSVHSCTIHKAQGSTYKNVFIDLNDIGECKIASDVARMMHVAVSRPTDKIVFRGKLPDKYGG